jgi:hypothetical protein
MKTIIIRLPAVEAAMLVEVQKVNRAFRVPGVFLSTKSSRSIRRRQREGHQGQEKTPSALLPSVTLTTPPAAGIFLSYHSAVQ